MSQVVNRQIEKAEKAEFGFWLYLMTDIILFASLFATYMILRPGVAGGPSAGELLDPGYALFETILLLTSSFTCGISLLALRFKNVQLSLILLYATIALGLGFITLEMNEFIMLVNEGASWSVSAFLSAFFTLVATHGLHITIGLIWAMVMASVITKRGATPNTLRKFGLFALFWHFLDLVWIFIFTIVYLGAGL